MEVLWPGPVKSKLLSFNTKYFTREETDSYLKALVSEIEGSLLNLVISKRYEEDSGKYKGVSKMVTHKFRIYYKCVESMIIVVDIKFPGEN